MSSDNEHFIIEVRIKKVERVPKSNVSRSYEKNETTTRERTVDDVLHLTKRADTLEEAVAKTTAHLKLESET